MGIEKPKLRAAIANLRRLADRLEGMIEQPQPEVVRREWHYPKDTPWPDGSPSWAAWERRVECPTCGAPVGAQCQTRAGKNTGMHGDRWVAARAQFPEGAS